MNENLTIIKDRDFSNENLSKSDLSNITFINCCFNNTNLFKSNFYKSVFKNCHFIKANLTQANFSNADLRGCNLEQANLIGTNFYYSLLEKTNLTNVIYNHTTQCFGNTCPSEGYIIGYKKCFNYRIVKLLIPKDAKRTSATNEACRCDKARVLSITSLDDSKSYTDAYSLNDSHLRYLVGQMVYPDKFNDDNWNDSTHGIHFFMTRQQAIDY